MKSLRERIQGREGKPGVLPLVAFYGGDPEKERRRALFYNAMERELERWERDSEEAGVSGPGRGGKGFDFIGLDDPRNIIINANAAPLEFLAARGDLESREDIYKMGAVRFHVGLRLRSLLDGSQVRGIQSPDFMAAGGGGGGPALVRDYQIDCIKKVDAVKGSMSQRLWYLLESVVWRDNWYDFWPPEEPAKKDRRARQAYGEIMGRRRQGLFRLHKALDLAGRALGYLEDEDFKLRWRPEDPASPAGTRPDRQRA